MADIPCVGAVVFDEYGRLLLVKRANPPAQGRWSLPGGRQEQGESARDGVVREVLEEAGIVVSVSREVGTIEREAPTGDTYVIRDFLCEVVGPNDVTAGDDAADARVFDIAAIEDLATSEGLLEALREWNLIRPAR